MRVLVNALGIQDSGGIRVLEKVLIECVTDNINTYLIVCNENSNINLLLTQYSHAEHFVFKLIKAHGFFYRLFLENIVFRSIIADKNIELVYNFSGSSQFFLKIPQLVKIQNLLFYSKKLDSVYIKENIFILCIKQIYLKRLVFKTMINNCSHFEIQSSHVQNNLADFIDIKNKKFYIKSDIDIIDKVFSKPKEYDFNKKIKFLYIVGPHFEYIHKNFLDFTNAMLELKKEDIDFEINITLTKEQLVDSVLWNNMLNIRTNFLGYIDSKEKIDELFCENTILISTSIIETLGLHVVEAIKKGLVVISPNEEYSRAVYGKNIITYELFDSKSLLNSVLSIIRNKINCEKYILTLQNDLKVSENKKYKSILDIFEKVINVQK